MTQKVAFARPNKNLIQKTWKRITMTVKKKKNFSRLIMKNVFVTIQLYGNE